jgi:archaellum component FlaC
MNPHYRINGYQAVLIFKTSNQYLHELYSNVFKEHIPFTTKRNEQKRGTNASTEMNKNVCNVLYLFKYHSNDIQFQYVGLKWTITLKIVFHQCGV